MFYLIYKITHKESGKIYIGKHQTKDLDDGYMGSGKLLKRAINKYGVSFFEKEILYQLDSEEEMNAKEAELVTEEFVECSSNYNLCVGGQGGFSYLNKNYWNTENRKLLGDNGGFSNKEKMNDETIERIRKGGRVGTQRALSHFTKHNDLVSKGVRVNGFKGKTHSDEWKEKHSRIMKESQKGTKNSQYGTVWIFHDEYGKRKIKKEKLPEYVENGWRRGMK